MTYVEAAEKYAKEIEEGFCKELTIYEGEPDITLDLKASYAFKEAVEICGRWLRELLLGELELHPEYRYVRCLLRLPCSNLDVSIKVKSGESGARGTELPELSERPYGVMDEFVFNALRMYDNPVKTLYGHMKILAQRLHNLLTLRGIEADFISQKLLTENSINDPVCIHHIESILCYMCDCLDGEVLGGMRYE